jgi:tRNA G18 (ribose-2'-O)-methylase SpoU
MVERIDDSADPRIAPYRAVGDHAALERDGLFVAEGRLVVERLLEDGRFAVQSVLVTAPAAAALEEIFAQRADVPVYVSPADVLEHITGFDFHRGCLALARRPRDQTPLADLSHATRVLALEGVGNPDNVGGLFRAALAFGVDVVVLDRMTADPLYRKAIRTSMAATLRVPFVRHDPWLEGMAALRAADFQIVALTPRPDAVPLADYAAHAPDNFVVLVGAEGPGLSQASLDAADVRVRIPVDPRADSLNVVTAASIALYALTSRPKRPGSSPRCGAER